MITLAMIITAVVFCIIVGILAARSDRAASIIRPILDVMQTIPSFVYLVPIVMLFGVGMVPAVIATIIFVLPPLVRLTNLGIRQVQGELVEAGRAFGSTPRQILWEIQLPLALRTIMTGINQTHMLALSMAVIGADRRRRPGPDRQHGPRPARCRLRRDRRPRHRVDGDHPRPGDTGARRNRKRPEKR
jgi:glycine betaine/proline transport system permease protein